MASWRTSLAGIATILGSLTVVVKAVSDHNYDVAMAAIPALVTGIGHLFARDNAVSSEEAGAK